MMRLLRNTTLRRALAIAAAVMGLVLLLLAPDEAPLGYFLVAAGLVLELVGMNLRHRDH